MARAQETFGKKERQKKRLKKREEKAKKKEQRKASDQDSMFVYVDENGHLVDTPPDPSKKIKVDAESIVLGIPKKEESDEEIALGLIAQANEEEDIFDAISLLEEALSYNKNCIEAYIFLSGFQPHPFLTKHF